MNKDKISIIIPTYNSKNFIFQSIDSALKQTYNNIEVIVIDDGSTDGTKELLEKHKNNKKLIVFSQNNKGLSCARNKGIELSSGKYIMFLDADDYLDLEICSILYNKLVENKCDISIASFERFPKNSKTIINVNEDEIVFENIKSFWNYDSHIAERTTSWGKLYKRELFDYVKFKPSAIHEDEYILHFLIDKCNRIYFTTKVLYHYRTVANSITNTNNSGIKDKKSIDLFNAMDLRLLYFINNKYNIKDYCVIRTLDVLRCTLNKNNWSKHSYIKRIKFIRRFYKLNYITRKGIKKVISFVLFLLPLPIFVK